MTEANCSEAKINEDLWGTYWIAFFTRDVVIVLGIMGNILISTILVQKHMRRTFNKLLVALAFSDTITLISCLASSVMRPYTNIFQTLTMYLLVPMRFITQATSLNLTVTIAYERFLAINNPHHYRKNKKYRTTKYVSFALISSVLLHLGTFFELEPTECSGLHGLYYGLLKPSEMFSSKIYNIWNLVYKVFITGLLPIASLIYLYFKIFQKIRNHNLNQAGLNEEMKNKIRKEQKLAGIFAGIVITSLICKLPDIGIYVLAFIYNIKDPDFTRNYTDSPLDEVFFDIKDTLAIWNSSINIIIYTFAGKIYRDELIKFVNSLFQNGTGKSTARPSVTNPTSNVKIDLLRHNADSYV